MGDCVFERDRGERCGGMVDGGIGGKFRVVALKGVGTGGGPIGIPPASFDGDPFV